MGAAEGQKGSVTYIDLILPQNSNKALFVEVQTNVPGQNSNEGFFVRPTRRTRYWGRPELISPTKASFYLAETGQFSVEFASDSIWRNKKMATSFDALMLFVNPEIDDMPQVHDYNDDFIIVTTATHQNKLYEDLGPNKSYVFQAGIDYDWGRDHV